MNQLTDRHEQSGGVTSSMRGLAINSYVATITILGCEWRHSGQ